MSWWEQVRDWVDPTSKMLKNLEERDAEVGREFREAVSTAPEGHYFRTLVAAVHKTQPFGQPIDFQGIVRELAHLEARVEDTAAKLGRLFPDA